MLIGGSMAETFWLDSLRSLTPRSGAARGIYAELYCRRGHAESHIKAWKRHLAADRTSCCRAAANQVRLMPHTGAFWVLWSLRRLMPRRSTWRVAQFDTLRLRLGTDYNAGIFRASQPTSPADRL